MLYAPKKETQRADRKRLAKYEVPTVADLKARCKDDARRASVGKRWAPMHHLELVKEIEAASKEVGLRIVEEAFILSDDEHDIYGWMRFDPDSAPAMPEIPGSGGIVPELGFRNSNMQRMRLIGVHGERVGVCENGMIAGDFLFGFKNTTGNVEKMEVGIREGVAQWERQAEDARRLIEFLVNEEVDYDRADQLLMEGARRGAYAWNQLGKIDGTYRQYEDPENPHHEAFAERNLWSLYNAVTEVAKGWSVRNVERGLKGFPRVLADAYRFELATELTEDTPTGGSSLSFSRN